LARLRRRVLDELAGIFLELLELAGEMKLLRLGTNSLDGTNLHANASRHSALSYGHIRVLDRQLKAEVSGELSLVCLAWNLKNAWPCCATNPSTAAEKGLNPLELKRIRQKDA
jgi:hypothetical protein